MGKYQISKCWGGLGPSSDAHAPKTSYDTKTGKDNKNILTNTHIMILKIIFTDIYFNILTFESDMKFIEPRHTLYH